MLRYVNKLYNIHCQVIAFYEYCAFTTISLSFLFVFANIERRRGFSIRDVVLALPTRK